jgi:putative oxygen-independent coproporphyrinogen III oxidase
LPLGEGYAISRLPAVTSAYVHFPYCLAKCPYCDFVSYKADPAAIDHQGYADAVLREVEARVEAAGTRTLGSVFFGGGTPSLWAPAELGRVLAGIRERFACQSDLEVTVECNPTSLDEARARELRAAGVNRLSIGTQSLRQEDLKFLGRLHDSGGALRAIEAAFAAGMERVSSDLIFALPEQSPEEAERQALALSDRGLTHMACYELTIEPGTQFGELAKRGRLPLASEGNTVEAFLAIERALTARGYSHYEISNYAKPGEEARHNLGYWLGDEYFGFGCAAVGAVSTSGPTRRMRYRNETDPARYMAKTRSMRRDTIGEGDGVSTFSEELDGEALLRERIMLGLRLSSGFDLEASARELGVDPWPKDRVRAADRLVSLGRLSRDGGRLRIEGGARLLTNDTAARLF